MTNEQIKQNESHEDPLLTKAREFMEHNYGLKGELIYIAGAHSRDEEIEHYRRVAEAYKIDAQDTAAECERLHDIIDELRNPWVSVEDRLPEDDVEVIGMTKRGFVFLIRRNSNEWCGTEYRELLCPEITHWIPIPQIQKGGEK